MTRPVGARNSSFGAARKEPGLPQPIDCIPELNLVLMERVPGQPLAELGAQEKYLEAGITLIAMSFGVEATLPSRKLLVCQTR